MSQSTEGSGFDRELPEMEGQPEALDQESPTEAGLADDLARVTRERDEYLAHWQRSQADYQNQRRRAVTELETHVRAALEPLLDDLLLVADHLDMALMSPAHSADAKNLALGVDLVRVQVKQLLDRAGVTPIETQGAFDPALHQAVMQVERADLAPGSCVETVRRGYLWRGRPLRFAQVKVSVSPSGPGTEAGSAG